MCLHCLTYVVCGRLHVLHIKGRNRTQVRKILSFLSCLSLDRCGTWAVNIVPWSAYAATQTTDPDGREHLCNDQHVSYPQYFLARLARTCGSHIPISPTPTIPHPSLKISPIMLLNPLSPRTPTNPILRILLHPRLQLRLMQFKIINRPDPHNTLPRIPTTSPPHQRPALRAEIIVHGVSRSDSFVVVEFRELVFAADVFDRGVVDYEVGGEH